MQTELTLPASLDAEVTLLGNMIQDARSVDTAFEIVRSSDEFYYSAHRIIFDAMISLNARGQGINRVNLVDCLMTSGNLDKAGGVNNIVNIANNYISGDNTKEVATLVHNKFLFRRLYDVATDTREQALKADVDIKSIISETEEKILDIGLHSIQNDPERINFILKNTAEELVVRSKLKGGISGLSTGFEDLDAMLSGFQKSDLILLAARPSMGKSAIMVNFAVAAAEAGKTVVIFSLEMSKEQLAMRIYSQLANIDLTKLLKGDLDMDDWKRISQAANGFSSKNLFIDDTSGVSITDIRAKLRRLALQQDGVDLVLIDYLQLMEAGGKIENRQQEISKISRGLKGLAKELNIPVIALSQLSRAPEMRSDHRPILSDLRESGAIEQDADVVMFLYRDEYYNKDSEDRGTGEVIIAKHRNGPTGSIKLVYKGENTKFLDMKNVPGDAPPAEVEATGGGEEIPDFI